MSFHHNQRMVTLLNSSMGASAKWARVSIVATTVAIWALAGACALYWGLRLSANRTNVVAPLQAAAAPVTNPQLVARMLGAKEASPAVQASLASRFSLQGVVAGGPTGGAALIAVDGKPARPFAVGTAVDDGLVLKSATGRAVALAETRNGPTLLTLEMPLLK